MKLAKQFDSPLDAKSRLASAIMTENAPPDDTSIEPRKRSMYSPIAIQHCTLEKGTIVEHNREHRKRSMYSPITIEYCVSSALNNNDSASASSNKIALHSSQQSPTFNGEEVTVCIRSTHEVVDYVIPSFSAITVRLRLARATFGTNTEQLDVFLNEEGSIPDRAPFFLKVSKKCTVEVGGFQYYNSCY